jgi:hypothetical protein
MLFAFPWKEFASDYPAGLGRTAVGHAMSLGDVVTDTVHQFAPTYQNYVLYSDGTTKNVPGGAMVNSLTPDGDAGLLYDVEMSPYDDDREQSSRANSMGTFLVKEDGEGIRSQSSAEKRWNEISLSPH